MAEAVFSTGWIPVEYSPDVIQRIKQMSAVEQYGQNVTMTTQSRKTPRSGGVDMHGISKGGTYSEDSSTNDDVTLNAQKMGGAVRIAEEDLEDSIANIVNTKTTDAATSYAKLLDNGCLAVTGVNTGYSAASSGVEPNWQFPSLYYLLTQNDSGAGYTANANINKTTAGTGIQYKDLSKALGVVESGDYWDEENLVVIAHPNVRRSVREILDTNGRPIFTEGTNGTPGGGQGRNPDRIFGYPVHWSLGAKTSAYPNQKPTGNPLVIFASGNYIQKGNRSPLEVQYIDGRTGLSALTDEAILKFRARKGFVPGHPNAFSILENIG